MLEGWTAWRYVEGEAIRGERYVERIEASQAFHRALSNYERPAFLDARDDPWSQADRIVWQAEAWEPHPRVEAVYTRLRKLTEPLTLEEQVIHGDISGNMLLAPGKPPVIIDFTPYWRPAAFAEAVLVIDAVMWEHASWDLATWGLAKSTGSGAVFFQLLVRAAMRRLAEVDRHYRLRRLSTRHLDQVDNYVEVAGALERLAEQAA